jgi:uncharacterized membrane protein (DUF2068 family)
MPARPNRVAPWEDNVLRLIGIFKLAKAALFISIGIGLLNLLHKNIVEILRYYVIDPMHFDPENRLLNHLVHWLVDNAGKLTPHGIYLISIVSFFYATVFATEGIGLYLRKHWAEYMVLISTGALLPVEFYEICAHFAAWKLGIAATNLAILLYLVHRLLLDSRAAPGTGGRNNDPSAGPTGSARASKHLDDPSAASPRDDSSQVVSEVP